MARMANMFRGALMAALGLWMATPVLAQVAPSENVEALAQGYGSPQARPYPHAAGASPGGKMPAGERPAPAPTPAPVPPTTPSPTPAPTPPGPPAAPATPAAPTTAAPTTPGAAAPTPAAEAFNAAAAFSPAEGGALGGAGSAFNMLGDQAPIFGRPTPPPPPHQPGRPTGVGGLLATKGGTAVPWIRSFKIADNQSPIPQDRVFFDFNYFNNLNYAIDRKFSTPVNGIQVYRYLGGFEKTFLNGLASVGMTESINNLSAVSSRPGLGGTSTAMGDLSLFTKVILYQSWQDNRAYNALGGFGFPAQVGGRNGGLISGGLAVSFPTGPGGFAGAPFSKSFRNTNLQPYLGYFYSQGNFYMQGFESISVPTDPNDVTILFNDIGIGYYVYRNANLDSFFTAFAPTFEVHANVPLNHTGINNVRDPVAMTTVVDLTLGGNFQFGRRTVLLLGAVTPVTGPRPYSVEALALLNFYFGGRGNRPTRPAYPMAGP